jgi:hypothetical protein
MLIEYLEMKDSSIQLRSCRRILCTSLPCKRLLIKFILFASTETGVEENEKIKFIV